MTVPFRFLDLIAAIAIAVVLLGATIVTRQQSQEQFAISQCASNLQRLGAAISQYRLLAGGAFPRTRYQPDQPITAYTGSAAKDPFGADGPAANDVTAPAYLLAREMHLPPEVFICTGAMRHGLSEVDTFDASTVRSRSNFTARIHYNYALANMYPDSAAVTAGYSLDDAKKLPANFVIAGDTSPGGAKPASTQPSRTELRMGNSPNHQREGQNLLAADGHVEYRNHPSVAGNTDNAYESSGTFPNPGGALDTVLLPDWKMGPDLTPDNVISRRWVFGGAMVGITLLLAYLVIKNRRRA